MSGLEEDISSILIGAFNRVFPFMKPIQIGPFRTLSPTITHAIKNHKEQAKTSFIPLSIFLSFTERIY